MTSSLLTSLFGLLAAAGAVAQALGYAEIGAVLLAVGAGGTGLAARDNNKSSETVGTK